MDIVLYWLVDRSLRTFSFFSRIWEVYICKNTKLLKRDLNNIRFLIGLKMNCFNVKGYCGLIDKKRKTIHQRHENQIWSIVFASNYVSDEWMSVSLMTKKLSSLVFRLWKKSALQLRLEFWQFRITFIYLHEMRCSTWNVFGFVSSPCNESFGTGLSLFFLAFFHGHRTEMSVPYPSFLKKSGCSEWKVRKIGIKNTGCSKWKSFGSSEPHEPRLFSDFVFKNVWMFVIEKIGCS